MLSLSPRRCCCGSCFLSLLRTMTGWFREWRLPEDSKQLGQGQALKSPMSKNGPGGG